MDLSMKERQTHRHGEELGGCHGGGSGREGLGGWGSQMPTVMYEMDRTSLEVQWLRIRLPTQGTWV